MSEKDRDTLRQVAGASGAGSAWVAALARSVLRLEKQVGEMDGRAAGEPSPQERKLGIGDIAELEPRLEDTRDRLGAVDRLVVAHHARLAAIEKDLLRDPPASKPTPEPSRPSARATEEIEFPSAGDVAKPGNVERSGSPKPVGKTPEG